MSLIADPGRTGRAPIEGNRCLTVPEAAEHTTVCARTLYQLIRAGRGPVITRISPRRYVIRQSDLEYWLNANAVRGAT